jgi:mannose-6-phosphate isomerase-like protein (cupin superfamily)
MTPGSIFDLNRLRCGVTNPWESFDLTTVNGNTVRLRVMQDVTADWHTHETSDELFYVISGTVHMDTEHGAREIRAGQLFLVPAGTRHRGRVEGRAAMLVVDGIGAAGQQDATARAASREGGTTQ